MPQALKQLPPSAFPLLRSKQRDPDPNKKFLVGTNAANADRNPSYVDTCFLAKDSALGLGSLRLLSTFSTHLAQSQRQIACSRLVVLPGAGVRHMSTACAHTFAHASLLPALRGTARVGLAASSHAPTAMRPATLRGPRRAVPVLRRPMRYYR